MFWQESLQIIGSAKIKQAMGAAVGKAEPAIVRWGYG